MRVLISNDDGIQAPGLHALAEAIAPFAEVWIVAPNRERSACSHSLSTDAPIRAHAVSFPVKVQGAWAADGTPADCVKLALTTLMPSPPDFVLTGINRGANLCVDIFYSGTVAGSMEAVFKGIPAIAWSLDSYDHAADYHLALPWIRTAFERIRTCPPPRGVMYNVNIPALPADKIKGFRMTRMGKVKYQDGYDARSCPRGKPYYWLLGEQEILDRSPDTDIMAVRDGFISITPLGAELTDFVALDFVKKQFPLDSPQG